MGGLRTAEAPGGERWIVDDRAATAAAGLVTCRSSVLSRGCLGLYSSTGARGHVIHSGMCGWERRLRRPREDRGSGQPNRQFGCPRLLCFLSAASCYSSRGATEVEDGSEKPGSSQGCSRHVKAAGLGQEVGGVTLVTARFGGIKGCLQTASAVGGFSDPPAVAGKGSSLCGA